MNTKTLEKLAKAALPSINKVRRAFRAPPLERLNLRCDNIVGSCPVAQALKPTQLQQVYSDVLTAERWDQKKCDFVVDRAKLERIAKQWGTKVKRKKFLDFCCHRHFNETAMVILLPPKVKAFISAFIDHKDAQAHE